MFIYLLICFSDLLSFLARGGRKAPFALDCLRKTACSVVSRSLCRVWESLHKSTATLRGQYEHRDRHVNSGRRLERQPLEPLPDGFFSYARRAELNRPVRDNHGGWLIPYQPVPPRVHRACSSSTGRLHLAHRACPAFGALQRRNRPVVVQGAAGASGSSRC